MGMIVGVVIVGELLKSDWILVFSIEHLKSLINNCCHSFRERVLDILQKVNVENEVFI